MLSNRQLAIDVLLVSKILLGYEEALWPNKQEISHVSQILTNACQILVLFQVSNYYCKSVKIFAFLHLWKSHVQNGRSDSTPKICTVFVAGKVKRGQKKVWSVDHLLKCKISDFCQSSQFAIICRHTMYRTIAVSEFQDYKLTLHLNFLFFN